MMARNTMAAAFALLFASGTPVAAGEATAERPAVLDSLSRLGSGRTMRSSSSDPNWRSGNEDSRPIRPGDTLTVADLDGPGVIRHIWFTINAEDARFGRSLTLRMYWDDAQEPAVESPIGDFFAVGHGQRRQVDSIPVAVTSEGRAFNCYWSMPFAKRARITLTNDSRNQRVKAVYWYVDWEKIPALPADTAYFHAQYRQEFPPKAGENYRILEAEGTGHYVGTVLAVYSRTLGWFGEGDDFFYIDGEAEPSLRGTGTEDYFCDAWGFREFCWPYYGVVQFDGFEVGDRITAYRWHIPDPVRFTKSLKVEIEHQGALFDEAGKRVSGCADRADLFSSVAFWYQTGKARRFATLPPAHERVVPQTLVELENSSDLAKALPADTKVNITTSGIHSDGRQLLALFSGGTASLTVPFKLAAKTQGVARLRLSGCPEGGIWAISLDGKRVPGSVDLYSHGLCAREVRIGLVDLAPGEHTLSFECLGRNPASSAYFLGVDAITIDEVTPYAVPAAP